MYVSDRWVAYSVFWVARLILFGALFAELFGEARWGFLLINVLALGVTFLVHAFELFFKIDVPLRFSFLFLFFVVFSVLTERFLSGWWVLGFFGLSLGFVGLVIAFVMYENSRVKVRYSLMSLFAFCFSVSINAVWEVFRFVLGVAFDLPVGRFSASEVILSLVLTMMGAVIASGVGYMYLRYEGANTLRRFAHTFRRRHPELIEDMEKSERVVLDIVRGGESRKVEFKSTLRMNLHTMEPDKRMEYEVARTIVAFLNSDGGVLLVGVDDRGSVVGLDVDGFENMDKFYRHFTNVVKKFVGNEFLPYIKADVVEVDGKSVLMVECFESDRGVFLKEEGGEEFFVRSGPASVKLEGSKLVAYIAKRFK